MISERTFKNQIPLVDLSSPAPASAMPQEVSKAITDTIDNGIDVAPLSYAVGDSVMHKSFGLGRITSIDNTYIGIKFANNEKRFLFPQCFEKGFFHV